MRDAPQQPEWLYIGRVRPKLLDQRLDMTALATATSPSAKAFSRIAVLACDKPRPAAQHARTAEPIIRQSQPIPLLQARTAMREKTLAEGLVAVASAVM